MQNQYKTKSKPTIKFANHLDLPFFIELEHRYFERYKPEAQWNNIKYKESFAQTQNYVVDFESISIGVLRVKRSDDSFHLEAIHIIEEYRNRGIGEFIVQIVERLAIEQSAKVLDLETSKNNPAINLFSRCGYKQEAIPESDSVSLRKELQS